MVLAFCFGVLLVACEDKRVKAVDTGISRDSAIALLSDGQKPDAPKTPDQKIPGPDTIRNVYRRSRYLIGGKEMEVLWFTSSGKRQGVDTVPYHKLTPIVLDNGKVIGKGWPFWDSVATANRIPVPPKDS